MVYPSDFRPTVPLWPRQAGQSPARRAAGCCKSSRLEKLSSFAPGTGPGGKARETVHISLHTVLSEIACCAAEGHLEALSKGSEQSGPFLHLRLSKHGYRAHTELVSASFKTGLASSFILFGVTLACKALGVVCRGLCLLWLPLTFPGNISAHMCSRAWNILASLHGKEAHQTTKRLS